MRLGPELEQSSPSLPPFIFRRFGKNLVSDAHFFFDKSNDLIRFSTEFDLGLAGQSFCRPATGKSAAKKNGAPRNGRPVGSRPV